MTTRPSYIEPPEPSEKWITINAYFHKPTNLDNCGFVRCRTCYVRFPPNVDEQSKVYHLKTHELKCKEFMKRVGKSLERIYNNENTIYGDDHERENLRLSV